MSRLFAQPHPPALVIGGMHRSTTSLAASILADAGLHLGDDLVAADSGNPHGHFEDVEFHLLLRRILAANGLSEEGFTSADRIDVPAPARDEAAALVARRRGAGRLWGWKDPRTVLFLDFWAGLLPEARWLFVVRPPCEVVDSLYRRGDTAFRVNPRLAGEVWMAYNRRILDFVREHPEQAAVIRAEDVVADHTTLVTRAAELLGTPLVAGPARFRPDLFTAGQPEHRDRLVRGVAPESYDLYRSLSALAGPAPQEIEPVAGHPRPAELAEAGLIEWQRGCELTADRGTLAQRLAAANETLAAEQEGRRQLATAVVALTRELDAARAGCMEVASRAGQAEQEVLHARQTAAALAARAEQAERELEHARHVSAALADRAEQAERELEHARQVSAALADRAEQAEQDLRHERQATNALAERAEQAERELDRARRESAELADRAEQAERELDRARQAVAALVPRAEAAEAERAALVAQVEAERGIYEALRQDLTARIEALRARGRQAA
jgi:ABC-type transporter Mla subunit MlaD